MDEDLIQIGEQRCRCPHCKAVVPRAVRRSDAQIVALCGACRHPALIDIEQPEPHRLTSAEIEALLGDAVADAEPSQKGALKTGRPQRERAPREDCQRMLARIDELMQAQGLEHYTELSRKLGLSRYRLSELRRHMRDGDITQQAIEDLAVRMARVESGKTVKPDDDGKSARATAAECEALLIRLDEVKAALGFWTNAAMCKALGHSESYLCWLIPALKARDVRRETVDKLNAKLASLMANASKHRKTVDRLLGQIDDAALRRDIETLLRAHQAGVRVEIRVTQGHAA